MRRKGKFLPILWQSVQRVVKAIGKSAKSSIAGSFNYRTAAQKNTTRSGRLTGLNKIFRNPLKKRRYARGFVLPVAIFLIILMGLIVGTMLTRSTNRSLQTVSEKSNQVIVNAATPAIDRAKAKLEFLFSGKDPRFTGLPTDAAFTSMLLNNGSAPVAATVPRTSYDFPDEVRLDINGDGTLDNAWAFLQNADASGTSQTVAYSILQNTVYPTTGTTVYSRTSDDTNKAKNLVIRGGPVASTQAASGNCGANATNASLQAAQQGWDPVSSASYLRDFQINAVAINPQADRNSRTVATLELQQDREADSLNKWGAWFRNDLAIYPGPFFNWNGAMHTEGNIYVSAGNGIHFFLITAPPSCLFSKTNSEITMSGTLSNTTDPSSGVYFLGNIAYGTVRDGNFNNDKAVIFDIYSSSIACASTSSCATPPPTWTLIGAGGTGGPNSSIGNSSVTAPDLIALDPIAIQTTGTSQSRASIAGTSSGQTNGINARNLSSGTVINTTWTGQSVYTGGRVYNYSVTQPFVDDLYRADNIYGPVPRYKGNITGFTIPSQTTLSGTESNGTTHTYPFISGSTTLVDNTIPNDDPNYGALTTLSTTNTESTEGLDGYWERRAWADGLRVIVGQRLELGNAYGWGKITSSVANQYVTNDPLYPAIQPLLPITTANNRDDEHKQWKTLRDNLAAVQSTAIYHASSNRTLSSPAVIIDANVTPNITETPADFPVACLSTTAHPGTSDNTAALNYPQDLVNTSGLRGTITNSVTFTTFPGTTSVQTNFLTGNGTNGWEFDAPAGNSLGNFVNYIVAGQPLGNALLNLANFAGDPKGAYPPTQDSASSSLSFPANSATSPTVHPYPYLTMWGDFSNLRRIVNSGNMTAANYGNLSLADQSTLHTASCTLGMLAYNLNAIRDSYKAALQGAVAPNEATANATEVTNFNNLGQVLFSLMDGIVSDGTQAGYAVNPEIGLNGTTVVLCTNAVASGCTNKIATTATCFSSIAANCPSGNLASTTTGISTTRFSTFTEAQWIAALQLVAASYSAITSPPYSQLTSTLIPYAQQLYSQIQAYQQVWRDRSLGFAKTIATGGNLGTIGVPPINLLLNTTSTTTQFTITGNSSSTTTPNFTTFTTLVTPSGCTTSAGGCVQPSGITNGTGLSTTTAPQYALFCNPEDFNMGTFVTPTATTSQYFNKIAIAQAFCSAADATGTTLTFTPEYPSLFYLFPRVDHTFAGSAPPITDVTAAHWTTMQQKGGVALQTTNTNWMNATEPYITDSYINGSTVNGASTKLFYAVNNTDMDGTTYTDGVGDDITPVVIQPRSRTGGTWKLPYKTGATATTARGYNTNLTNSNVIYDAVNGTSQTVGIGFLDKGMANGREMMGVRILDFDFDILRKSTNNLTADSWLPNGTTLPSISGLVYAFREDAIREDGIQRPKSVNAVWTSCNKVPTGSATTGIMSAACLMKPFGPSNGTSNTTSWTTPVSSSNPLYPQDPPQSTMTTNTTTGDNNSAGVSPKSVDFYPDPDRRPYGFRITNASSIIRPNPTTTTINGITYSTISNGITFVTDNPVYLSADETNSFNLQSNLANSPITSGTAKIEEFTTTLPAGTYSTSQFYGRTGDNSSVFANFTSATAGNNWRPIEILSDSITILSNNFQDGSIDEGIANAYVSNGTCTTSSSSVSYCDFLTPVTQPPSFTTVGAWLREDGSTTSTNLPIVVSQNGDPLYCSIGTGNAPTPATPCLPASVKAYGRETTPNTYGAIGGTNPKNGATSSRFYFVTYSGISPARLGNDYGGLHNFPRFLESWSSVPLYISGSLIQLNYSNYATAPFDQDAWEPTGTQASTGTEYINYYVPPNRIWGYDVALQYISPGAAARRYTVPNPERSEYYRTVQINDPYIYNLRCAKIPSTVPNPYSIPSTLSSMSGKYIDPLNCP